MGAKKSTLDSFLASWENDPSLFPNITAWQVIPERFPDFVDLPRDIDPRLADHLHILGIQRLYKHQQAVWQAIQNDNNALLVTGTSSGKTLAFNLPVLDHLLNHPESRALYLYPTKALAHDQLFQLEGFPFIASAAYDGDTPQRQRRQIREFSQLIISNPDMLHLGILPYHMNWSSFFSNLKFIVLDEIHVYRGVFGSHVANVLRRLKRVASHYGAHPHYILTSATIGNPADLSELLIGEKAVLIDQDGSARGKKHFLIYNPPLLDERLGLRASMQKECIRLSSDLIRNRFQTIIFGRSRKSVEFMLSDLRASLPLGNRSLRSYRSGYLPELRREIESGLRSGEIRGVCATTALELGMDIGGLDASILAGYPGTVAGTWQQAGRSGRGEKTSLSALVVSSSPLDQYLAHHPEYILSGNPESALIDPDNLLIVIEHMLCAAYELPFAEKSQYGSFSVPQTGELLAYLESTGSLMHRGGGYFWISEEYPAAGISLRTASPDQVSLRCNDPDTGPSTLGIIDKTSSFWMVHPGAIYLHEGEVYLVEELDLETNVASLVPSPGDYYTEPERQTSFAVNEVLNEKDLAGARLFQGDITVTEKVTGYKRINRSFYELIGKESLDLPETSLATAGTWLSLSNQIEEQLRSEGLWNSSPNDYGPEWDNIRELVLERDSYTCQICHTPGDSIGLHVHHRVPIRMFSNLEEANQLGNLVSLCPRCHQRAEAAVRVNSGIRGLGYALHHLAPLLLMCDPGDIGVYTDFQSPLGDRRPVVLLHEFIPGGIGFSRVLFSRFSELIGQAYELVSNCPCLGGCPSCVGPGGEIGSGGKAETLAILEYLHSH
jgi:DEAD/DEAH box helicase domain-containing protein